MKNVTILCTSRTKEKIKVQCTPRLHFAACYIMEMQMVFYQNSVINETYEVSHTTTYVLVANALSNSDINNYLILIYQEKMSDRDM